MKNHITLTLFILLLAFSSCSYQHDKNAHERLIKSHIRVNEKIVSDINEIQKNINGKSNTISFLMQDPEFKEKAQISNAIYHTTAKLSGDLDDLLIFKLNELIQKEENESDWFYIDNYTRICIYKDISSLKHKDGSIWTSYMFGADNDEAISNSNLIRNSFHSLRNNLILELASEVPNWKQELIYISNGDLVSYEYFKNQLIKNGHPWKNKLLNIYNKLTIPKTIMASGVAKKWNIHLFKNEPLIGAISVFNFLRKDIKEAQNIAGEILVDEILNKKL